MAHTGIIAQARMGSTRLPGKVLADLCGAPALDRLVERLRRVPSHPQIIIATSTLPGDDALAAHAATLDGVGVWRGSESDVLSRYAEAAEHFDLDPIVRITADCPLMEPAVLQAVLDLFERTPGCDYADNVTVRTFPHGFDVQVVSRRALRLANAMAKDLVEREHVLPYINSRPGEFRCVDLKSDTDNSDLRITLDYPEDLALIRAIYEKLFPGNPEFGLDDILALRARDPQLFEINAKHIAH